ncbi:hypothetical protein L2E82_10346 [Cichorium intybus]|uniref:Uncharacterized protein n=1 Tax=Cichorium intybus TaxID=13427 RepID=A0ACB9GAW8_CICIN|nr:hypothetical protein L2E82_10346 [Cichorium intybus]
MVGQFLLDLGIMVMMEVKLLLFVDSNGIGQAQNRPDIVARIFQIKVSHFIKFLKEDKTFGDVTAYLYTIEFQKRGLPYCHTLLWHILLELENLLNVATPSKSLSKFHLPMPCHTLFEVLRNRLLLEEKTLDTLQLQQQHAEMASMLNLDQLRVYNRIQNDQNL